MNFYKTKMGQAFFHSQFPRLVTALESIAKTLRSPTPAYQVNQEVPPEFLRDLYHGNYDPSGGPDSPEIQDCNRQIARFQEDLRKEVSDRAWSLIEDYRELLDARHIRQLEDAFSAGFHCASTMFAAGLSAPWPGQPHQGRVDNEKSADGPD